MDTITLCFIVVLAMEPSFILWTSGKHSTNWAVLFYWQPTLLLLMPRLPTLKKGCLYSLFPIYKSHGCLGNCKNLSNKISLGKQCHLCLKVSSQCCLTEDFTYALINSYVSSPSVLFTKCFLPSRFLTPLMLPILSDSLTAVSINLDGEIAGVSIFQQV